jgi:hypothetical protein
MKTRLILFTFLFAGGFIIAQELALANDKGMFGYITQTGDWQIKPEFKSAKNFSGDLAEALNTNKKWGYINRKGEWAIQPSFDKTNPFDSGIALVSIDKEWFYINTKGEKILTDIKTDKFYDFQEGFAIIRQGDKVGFINTSGKVIVPTKFNKVFNFENGYAKVREGEKWGLIDASGNYFVKTEYDGVSNFYGTVVANIGNRQGLIVNGEFKEVEGAQKIWDFSLGSDLTYAKKDDKIGFINNKGEWVIEPIYEKARAFVNGLAPVFKDKSWGYIDASGKEVIPFQYRDAEIFSKDGLAPVKLNKLWGFIDKTGNLVIPDRYDITAIGFSIFEKNNPKGFYNGLSRVKENKVWGYINTKGDVLKNRWYQNLELFY